MVDAVVAGHVCLDIIPQLPGFVGFDPGRLIEAGPVTLSTGGAVSNTGLGLTKLGQQTRLIGKVGQDHFGRTISDIFDSVRPGLGGSLAVTIGQETSYTIVINVEGADRMFLHCPGCNNTFVSADIPDEALENTRLFHFGYPPLMAQIYADGGKELESIFRRAKQAGATTSLDMSLPDRSAPSGQANWHEILARVLPYVDIFLPSVEELLFCVEPETFDQLLGAVLSELPRPIIERIANKALGLGAKVLGMKVGARGFMLLTRENLEGFGRVEIDQTLWSKKHLWHPCYSVKVSGTTGSGDATIAGFLMGVLKGFSPIQACQAAVAVGACCCEKSDAVSGVRTWENTKARIDSGWECNQLTLESEWVKEETGYGKVMQ